MDLTTNDTIMISQELWFIFMRFPHIMQGAATQEEAGDVPHLPALEAGEGGDVWVAD